MASPELGSLIAMMRAQPRPENPSVAEMRGGFEALAGLLPCPPDVARTPVQVAGRPAEWVAAPGADPTRAILYLHGGGYVIGSLNTHRELAGRLSRASGARVLLLDYRLAPEHPFPAAVDDAAAAWRWLLAQGVAARRAVVAGDSAGGGLAVATLLRLRDAGDPLPAAGVCLSPWVDLEAMGASMQTRAAADPIVQREPLLRMARLYLGTASARDPLASPLHGSLQGLPPLLVHVGDAETLLDDATRLAERARAASVEVTLEVWPEMIHVWHLFAPLLPEGAKAVDGVGAFVRERSGG